MVAVAATTVTAAPAPAHALAGGAPANEEEYSFVAKIYGSERMCTGALIDPQWLISASTCFAEDPSQGHEIPAGEPVQSFRARIGSPDLTGGYYRDIVELVPRGDRDVVLAKLDEPVLDIAPLSISTTMPTDGEILHVAGHGRTATEWYPGQLHTSTFSVASTSATTVALSPATADAAICKGDAGGPALRETADGFELVAINSASWQHGCLGETETRTGAVDTRLDNIADWLERSPVQRRIATDATLASEIGQPVGAEVIDWPYRYQEFERGAQRARLYWAPGNGTYWIRGAILGTYLRLGGHTELGTPITDETSVEDGVGSYNNLRIDHCLAGAAVRSAGCTGYGVISHTPDTGAHYLDGTLYYEWSDRGREQGVLGYPTTDEILTKDSGGKSGRYVRFSKDGASGTLYWALHLGTNATYGAIDQKWAELGREKGGLGAPATEVTATPDGIGRYVHFEGPANGSIYWTPDTGAWEVHGLIKAKWASMGWERSYLGYPITDEFAIDGGRRNLFQGGRIDYSFATGKATAYRN